jgi:acetolactate synthase-1/2/3 large subunit
MLGATCVAEYIKSSVGRIFTFPGGTVAPLYDVATKIYMPIYVARHEQGAGYAALACARISGKPEVVMVTSGPGVTNLLTVLADAFYDSTPLVAITGQVGTGDLQSGRHVRQRGFQEVDTSALAGSITKAVFQPLSPVDLPDILEQAFSIASGGRPGPVVIDLPMDVQRGEFIPKIGNSDYCKDVVSQLPDLTEAMHTLTAAQKPVILAGHGVLLDSAVPLLRSFAVKHGIPVVSSLLGLGSMQGNSSFHLGFLGHTGMQACGMALQQSDCALILGSRLDVRQTGTVTNNFCPQAQIIRVDIDRAELAHSRVRSDIILHARIVDILDKFNALPQPSADIATARKAWLKRIAQWQREYPVDAPLLAGPALTGVKVIRCFNQKTEGQKITASTGVGAHQQWVARHFTFDWPERVLLTSGGHGAMGYDLPSIMGAAMARPDAIPLCFVGDASFQINMQELQFAIDYKLPVRIVIFDNNRMAMVSQFQQLTWGNDPTTGNVSNPDFVAVAKAYGYAAEKLDDISHLESAVDCCLAAKGPSLLHCKISTKDDVLPMLLAGQALDGMYPFVK